MAENSKQYYGTLVVGRLRSVKEVEVRPEDGTPFKQLVATVDTGEDWLPRVKCPRGQEADFKKVLEPQLGQEVTIVVGVGDYRSLWFQALA